jgi:hypothetical protein
VAVAVNANANANANANLVANSIALVHGDTPPCFVVFCVDCKGVVIYEQHV